MGFFSCFAPSEMVIWKMENCMEDRRWKKVKKMENG